MADQFCTRKLKRLTELINLQEDLMLTSCVLNLLFSLVAVIGNLVVIHALWKASSMPSNVKKLLLSLAFSDLAVGILSQPTFGVINVVMLKMASTGDYNYNSNFASFCPTILNAYYFLLAFLSTASFLNVTAISVDRLLAISLHLRYQELVTSKRVIIGLVSLWLTSAVAAFIFILLPKGNEIVLATFAILGVLVSSVAYIRIYKAVRCHQDQIQRQIQLQNAQRVELFHHTNSAYNSLFIYIVYIACYLPFSLSLILYIDNWQISLSAASQACVFLVFLNSSLNPLVYCWRYREIREITKSTVKKLFHIKEHDTIFTKRVLRGVGGWSERKTNANFAAI